MTTLSRWVLALLAGLTLANLWLLGRPAPPPGAVLQVQAGQGPVAREATERLYNFDLPELAGALVLLGESETGPLRREQAGELLPDLEDLQARERKLRPALAAAGAVLTPEQSTWLATRGSLPPEPPEGDPDYPGMDPLLAQVMRLVDRAPAASPAAPGQPAPPGLFDRPEQLLEAAALLSSAPDPLTPGQIASLEPVLREAVEFLQRAGEFQARCDRVLSLEQIALVESRRADLRRAGTAEALDRAVSVVRAAAQ